MSRPKCCRRVGCAPDKNYFKPKGIPASQLEEVILTLDEFEAIRLADFGSMYQEDAAGRMAVSRQTFGRIIESAHRKIADALINGKALKIEGGEVEMGKMNLKRCPNCRKEFSSPDISNDKLKCPRCRKNIKSIIQTS